MVEARSNWEELELELFNGAGPRLLAGFARSNPGALLRPVLTLTVQPWLAVLGRKQFEGPPMTPLCAVSQQTGSTSPRRQTTRLRDDAPPAGAMRCAGLSASALMRANGLIAIEVWSAQRKQHLLYYLPLTVSSAMDVGIGFVRPKG